MIKMLMTHFFESNLFEVICTVPPLILHFKPLIIAAPAHLTKLGFSLCFFVSVLLAPQSGAHRIAPHRDFHPIQPIHTLIALEQENPEKTQKNDIRDVGITADFSDFAVFLWFLFDSSFMP